MLPPSTDQLPEQPVKPKRKHYPPGGEKKPTGRIRVVNPEGRNAKPKRNELRSKGALLYAQGKTTKEIAEASGVSLHTAQEWVKHPSFRETAQRAMAAMREKILNQGISLKEKRLAALDDRWMRCQAVIEERSQLPGMDRVPGGRTGLLVASLKTVGVGRGAEVAREYQVDCDLLREMRELEAAAAAEMGHRTSQSALTVQPVMLVMSQGQNSPGLQMPQQRLANLLPEAQRPQLPGVVIDLVPDKYGQD